MLENLLTDEFKSKYWPSKLDSSQWIKIVFEETWMNPRHEICPLLDLLTRNMKHKGMKHKGMKHKGQYSKKGKK